MPRKQHQAIDAEDSRQSAILNALPAHIALLDTEGVIVSVNDAWRQFSRANNLAYSGYGIGLNYLEICDNARGDDSTEAHEAAEGIRSVLRGEENTFSIEYPCHSIAETRWFVMKVTPLADDSLAGAVVMHINVTAEKMAKESLRASELRFRQMAENISDVFFLQDLDGSKLHYVSPAYEQIWGRSCESVYANPRSWADAFHPDDLHLAVAQLSAASDAGFDYEFRIIRPDGELRWLHVRGFPIPGEPGTPCRIAGVVSDITLRKLASEERQAIEQLKSEFVATVSHELRTPLTSIRGALGILGSGLLGPIEAKGKRMLEIAVTNADRLMRLINDILDLERVESGNVELLFGPVYAGTVMVQALEGVQSMADLAGVSLTVVPAKAVLWGDSDRILQTLTNLLGNAIKFSPPDTTVTLSGSAGEAEFVFCVTDQGRGVPEEKLETIFGRFSQVDASDSRDKGGSGLGLAICQSIVNAHGGRIWAERSDPVGSRFLFTIPLEARV